MNDIFEPGKELFYLLRKKKAMNKTPSIDIKLEIFRKINGLNFVSEIIDSLIEESSIDRNLILEIISRYASIEKYMTKIEICPLIIKINDEVKKMFKSTDLALIYTLENLSDGERSLKELSNKIGIPIPKIKRMLVRLGSDLIFRKRRVNY